VGLRPRMAPIGTGLPKAQNQANSSGVRRRAAQSRWGWCPEWLQLAQGSRTPKIKWG